MDKPNLTSDIRIASFAGKGISGIILRIIGPLLDRLLGLSAMRKFYESHNISGLKKRPFIKAVFQYKNIRMTGVDELLALIPKEGPLIVTCNHPLGGLDGMALLYALSEKRKDVVALTNVGLSIFKELGDFFIFTNPLNRGAASNSKSLRSCVKHLNNNGVLLLFPASRVSFYQHQSHMVTDGEWNKLLSFLARRKNTPVLPVFIGSKNSPFFYNMGRIYYRFRLMLLTREFMKSNNMTIDLHAGELVNPQLFDSQFDDTQNTAFMRVLTQLQAPEYDRSWKSVDEKQKLFQSVAAPVEQDNLEKEIFNLPKEQHLLDYREYSVWYGYQRQMPQVVHEIARLRELVFRELEEGSGEPVDTDKFDASYTHLFVYDTKQKALLGAYRMGQTDVLQKEGGLSSVYLSQMFVFEDSFVNQQQPCLEMGRSFIAPEYQKKHFSLHLLWKAIGAFVIKHPRYTTLYGTVSLSRTYDPRSVALISQMLLPKRQQGVSARYPFVNPLQKDIQSHLENHHHDFSALSALVKMLEHDHKDLPILLKHYFRLNAQFHCIGLDPNFVFTPGLLLSVDLNKIPAKQAKLYLNGS